MARQSARGGMVTGRIDTCIITHKNDVIISLSNLTEPLACGSKQKFDNDYDVILCVINVI